MTKKRKITSVETGIAEAIKILKDQGVADVTKKSASFLRKCSDPDLEQQIQHKDSIAIDLACIEKGRVPPMLLAHQSMLDKKMESIKRDYASVSDTIMKLTVRLGKLVDVTNKSLHPESEGGQFISKEESEEILNAIKSLEEKILKLKLSVKE